VNVLIAPDKFKGTLSARAAAEAIAAGWRTTRPTDTLTLLPTSDGGDGFGEILSSVFQARPQRLRTADAAQRPLEATWWWEPKSKTAFIESANIIGLALLPPGKFHPFQLDTFGLGAVLQAAARKGARRCFIGIGGSATNDGGFGLARALGWKFLNRSGDEITSWPQLAALTRIIPPPRRIIFPQLIVAVDVQNKLLGARGCSRIYGPQKGLRPEDFLAAERALRVMANLAKRELGRDFSHEPGAGAAGGLGFGLAAFAGGKLQSGFDLIARHAKLGGHLRHADLVITGEGALDRSSLMGKGPGEIARRCRAQKIPCLGLGGVTNDLPLLKKWFLSTGALVSLTSSDEAKAQPARWLKELSRRTAVDCALKL